MNRLPYWSKDRLGSQQASPSLSLLPISFVDQVLPPSKLTPSNMPAVSPASLCPTLVTTTMFLGFVGLTAIASSDSLRCRWLTSTFSSDLLLEDCALGAPPDNTSITIAAMA